MLLYSISYSLLLSCPLYISFLDRMYLLPPHFQHSSCALQVSTPKLCWILAINTMNYTNEETLACFAFQHIEKKQFVLSHFLPQFTIMSNKSVANKKQLYKICTRHCIVYSVKMGLMVMHKAMKHCGRLFTGFLAPTQIILTLFL